VLFRATCGNTRMVNLVMERALYASVAFGDKELSVRALDAAVKEIGSCQVEVANRLAAHSRRRKMAVVAAAAAVLVGLSFAPLFRTTQGSASLARLAASSMAGLTATPVGADVGGLRVQADEGVKAPAPTSAAVAMENASAPDMVASVAPTPHKKQAEKTPPKTYPESYAAFLDKAGMGEHLSVLDRAVQERKVGILEEVVPEGSKLLKLDRLPAQTGVPFSSFPWKKLVRESPAWLVLWEPPFVVQDFYYGYRSKDILALQKMLKRLGYYWGQDDGMVGPVTWRAINSFQKDMKLKRTMWPDPETVFWLTVMAKQG
jgi:hypothetical protein